MSEGIYERTRPGPPRISKPGPGLYHDPLYGYIPLPTYMRSILDEPLFQRMREIKQLSLVYLNYPGAVHTRFDHSVGVAHLAGLAHRSVQEQVQRKPKHEDPPELNEITLAAVQLAGLLHDIGHGPFGHVFEHFARRVGLEDWTHEGVGRRIITGSGDTGHAVKSKLEEVRRSLRAGADPLLSPANIYRISAGMHPELESPERTRKYHFLADIIPSAFGVDRLDYLRRDAYFSGAGIGNVDVWEILHSMDVARDSEARWVLRLHSNASTATESLLEARSLAYRRLYHNPINRCAQELLIRGLHELNKEGRHTPSTLALATDMDVLNALSLGPPLARDIHNRIRDRNLYESIALCSHLDLPESYKRLDFQTLVSVEEKICRSAGLSNTTVLFDLEIVPAIKDKKVDTTWIPEDYHQKWFIDPVKGEVSLFELEPHLDLLYGRSRMEKEFGHRKYNRSVSDVYIFFPFSLIEEAVQETVKSKVQEPADALYAQRLEGVVRGFLEQILGLNPKEFGELEGQMRTRVMEHLRGLLEAAGSA